MNHFLIMLKGKDLLIKIEELGDARKQLEEEYQEKHLAQGQPLLKITDERKIVEILLKWWQTKYPMTEGQRNHNVYVIAQALNEFGINKTTASIICNN